MLKGFAFILQLSLLALTVKAEEQKHMTIFAEPLDVIFGQFDGRYMAQVGDRLAITVPFSIRNLSFGLFPFDSLYNANLGIGLRFFLSGSAFNHGWFIEPEISGLLQVSTEIWDEGVGHELIKTKRPNPIYNGGVLAKVIGGYNWFWSNGLMVSLGIGTIGGWYSQMDRHDFIIFPSWQAGLGYCW